MARKEENKEKIRGAGRYLAHLIGCAINERQAMEKPEAVIWEDVYRLAKSNSVEGVSYLGLEGLAGKPEKNLLNRWKDAYERTIFRALHFDLEREAILAELKHQGISYLPLKGIHIAGYYPKPGMRSMADNDILYGFVEKAPEGGYRIRGNSEEERTASVAAAQEIVVDVMRKRGYQVSGLNGGAHESCLKEPFYNFEMHRILIAKGTTGDVYYENPWKRAIRDSEDENYFLFSKEDEYIYMIVHAYKHFDNSGCGIRSVADQYVFRKTHAGHMDWAYVDHELEMLGLKEYEDQMNHLAAAIFADAEEADEESACLLYYILGCGTYGNVGTRVKRQLQKLSAEGKDDRVRLKYLINRLYPKEEAYREVFSVFYRYPVLMPFLPLYRMGRAFSNNPRRIWSEWKVLWNSKNDTKS